MNVPKQLVKALYYACITSVLVRFVAPMDDAKPLNNIQYSLVWWLIVISFGLMVYSFYKCIRSPLPKPVKVIAADSEDTYLNSCIDLGLSYGEYIKGAYQLGFKYIGHTEYNLMLDMHQYDLH